MSSSTIDLVRILAIAPYEALAAALRHSAEGFPNIRLDVFTGDLQEGIDILRSIDLSLYDAIISRGGTADLIQQEVEIPVVEVPVQIYDILRTIKLAENYTDRVAIIGFPKITENAHILCNLLKLDIRIETVHHSDELPTVLDRLRDLEVRTVICDVVSHKIARAAGFQPLLITSGESSLHLAIETAERQGAIFRRIQNETLLLRTMLQQNLQQCVVLNEGRDTVYSFARNLTEETLAAMRRRVSLIPESRELLFYHQEGNVLHAITASAFEIRGQRLFLFRDQPAQIPLRSAQSGIRFYDAAECEQLFSGSFLTLRGSMGDLETRLTSLSAARHPVIILGEEGTGREQVARALYLQSDLRNHPLVVVDGARLNDRSWAYLTEHQASPLGTTRTAVFFHHVEDLSPQRQHTLLSLIEETGLSRRLWLIFACVSSEGKPLHAFTRELASRLGPLTLSLPSLRDRRDEIPALSSLYLSNLNMELGKQLFGFEPAALEMLIRYDWPGNYTQFKHVLQESAMLAQGMYISGAEMAECLARERRLYFRQTEGLTALSSNQMTLDEMIQSIIEQTLAECNGNQSLAARRLGIGRSTIWRILGRAEQSGKK